MTTARLMDAPEDYKNLRTNPSEIEVWEDARPNKETGNGGILIPFWMMEQKR